MLQVMIGMRILIFFRSYHNTYRSLTKHTPFFLVYGKEGIMPMDFLAPILRIMLLTCMIEEKALQHKLDKPMELEKDRVLVSFH